MRIRTSTLIFSLALTAVALSGCSSKKSRSPSASLVAPTTSGTTGATTSGTTAPTTSVVVPKPATPGVVLGGNTSSGSATSGATASGFGKGTGQFTDASNNLPASTSNDYGADSGDLDGDGDIDVAIAVNGGPARILWNDGTGVFTLRPASFPTTVMAATSVRLIDADQDGDFDLIFSANFEPTRLFLNDGAGNFTFGSELNPTNDAYTYNLAIGDANGDGWNDVFMVQAGLNTPSQGQNKLYLSDMVNSFVEAPAGTIPAAANDSLDATFLDVNQDGSMDIFVANFGSRPLLLVNNTLGTFVNQSDVYIPPTLSTFATGIAQGDMDGDGDVDLFVANEGPATASGPPAGQVNTWLDNNGPNQRFSNLANAVPSDSEATWRLRLVDVNADGQLDVVASQLRASQRLYINQGGTLIDATSFLPPVNQAASNCFGITVGDFNGDQAPDLLFTRRGAQPFLFLNTP
ncbi:MAG: VCBS repeat-containing protein [Planctomycetes bacterium]|nr:VCBS repeat-containing protein [Planctomycetota bacterium]